MFVYLQDKVLTLQCATLTPAHLDPGLTLLLCATQQFVVILFESQSSVTQVCVQGIAIITSFSVRTTLHYALVAAGDPHIGDAGHLKQLDKADTLKA